MMRYQKIVSVLMTFLVLLNVSACARSIQDDLQSSSEEAHEEQSEVKEAKSVLPNSWKMEQFVIAGFDKDGPGDFGRQVSLSDEEQAELLQLLDIESWEACEGIEHGLSVCLTDKRSSTTFRASLIRPSSLGTARMARACPAERLPSSTRSWTSPGRSSRRMVLVMADRDFERIFASSSWVSPFSLMS